MDLIIQHEYYRQFLASRGAPRDVDADADAAEAEWGEERVYEWAPAVASGVNSSAGS